MSEAAAPAVTPKPKKSVALSGVTAGNTALCTVGRTGNDLHYCGYDILDLAEKCEFEEVAHLLVHGKLPTAAELKAYKTKLQRLRGIPVAVQDVLECIPASAHPMDVLRTGCSALGAVLPEGEEHKLAPSRDIADRLMASFGSMLLYWYHFSHSGRRIEVETDDDSIGGHFLHLLHGRKPSELWVRAMHTSLILYAEHEFNASTFTARVVAGTNSDMYSAITAAIGALKGPKHGGANEFAFDTIAIESAAAAEGALRASPGEAGERFAIGVAPAATALDVGLRSTLDRVSSRSEFSAHNRRARSFVERLLAVGVAAAVLGDPGPLRRNGDRRAL